MVDEVALQAQLDAIRASFIEELPAREQRILTAWQAVLDSDWSSEEQIRNFHREVHSLAGAGATFNCANISREARVLEIAFQSASGDRLPPPDAAVEELQGMLANLRSTLSKAQDVQPVPVAGQNRTETATFTRENQPLSAGSAQRVIYIYDPAPELVTTLVDQLMHFGCEARVFTSVKAFSLALHEQMPNALIIHADVGGEMLAVVNVLSAEDVSAENMPIICLSDKTDIASRLAAVRCGCRAYMAPDATAIEIMDRLFQLQPLEDDEAYRVLVVEDNQDMSMHYTAVLENAGFVVRAVTNPMQLLDAVKSFSPELLLMDLYMPECNGMELASVVRQQDRYVGLPIVYLSSETDRDKQLDAMSEGADEFLTKSVAPGQLISVVRSRVQRARRLSGQLRRDGLTGLLNHTSTKDALEVEVARAERYAEPLCLAMLDIDHFKHINDTYGHPVGDRVIMALARLLQGRSRKTDIVGRFGGEEFVIVFPGMQIVDAVRVLEELREAFAEIRQPSDHEQFSSTFSAGVVAYQNAMTGDEMIQKADEALYAAKHAGRNRVVKYAD